jgi:hypothetical protein
MRIEILTSVAGERFSYAPGEFDVGDKGGMIPELDAFELLRDGIAKIIGEEHETQAIAAPEAAVTRRGRGRPRGSRNRPKLDA